MSQIVSNLKATEKPVIGVDVGGTKIAAGLVDAAGQISNEVKFPTDTASPRKILQSIAHTIRHVIDDAGISTEAVRGIGLGIPGKVDAEKGIGVFAANMGWQNEPIQAWLEEEIGLPCRIENDVRAAALGETLYGAGQGVANMVYLSLGTGIASGTIINGQLYRGSQGLAGEIGHLPIQPDGPLCKCGGRGCLEALAAGPAIAKRAAELLRDGQNRKSSLTEILAIQGQLNTEAVFAAARQKDEVALAVLAEIGAYLAHAVQLLVLTYDPQSVVLGGGLALQGELLTAPVQTELQRLAAEYPVFGMLYHPDLMKLTSLGRQAGIYGAAAIFVKS